MKLTMAIVDESANSLDTSDTLRIFSFLSLGEKPRSELRPNRTLSPSRRYALRLRSFRRYCSSAEAMVDLPEAERPVSQTVKPRCLRISERAGCGSVEWCHVMFLPQ